MNNITKKYEKPTIEVSEMEVEVALLQSSSTDTGIKKSDSPAPQNGAAGAKAYEPHRIGQ